MGWLLLYGWGILIWAIVINIAAAYLGVISWYGYFQRISETDFLKATTSLTVFEMLFLYLIYPGLLGLAVFVLVIFI